MESTTSKQTDKLNLKDGFFFVLFLLALFGSTAFFIWILTPNSIRYPVLYGTLYQIRPSHVDVEKKPTECEWEHAPLGDTGCRYTAQITTIGNDAGRVTHVSVTWDKVQD